VVSGHGAPTNKGGDDDGTGEQHDQGGDGNNHGILLQSRISGCTAPRGLADLFAAIVA
jgi:hypothetical protein